MNKPSKKLIDTILEVGLRWVRKSSESPLGSLLSCALTEQINLGHGGRGHGQVHVLRGHQGELGLYSIWPLLVYGF